LELLEFELDEFIFNNVRKLDNYTDVGNLNSKIEGQWCTISKFTENKLSRR